MQKIKRSLSAQISLMVVAMVSLAVVLVGVASYILYRKDSIDYSAQRALAIAQSAAAAIDGDSFTAILESGEKTEGWQAAKTTLDNIKKTTGVAYLYVLGSEYSSTVRYYAEGYNPDVDSAAELDLGQTEPADYFAQEMFDAISTGKAKTSGLYPSGEFGVMTSGFAPIQNSAGQVVGVVGVDISLGEVMSTVRIFGFFIALIMAVLLLAAGIFSIQYIKRRVGVPLSQLTAAAGKMAAGGTSPELGHTARLDEIGVLSSAFANMADGIRGQVDILSHLAGGDLSIQAKLRSEEDIMGQTIAKTLGNLNARFNEVNQSSEQVAVVADEMAAASQALASGSTQQAATLQQFSASIDEVLEQSQENAQRAISAHEAAGRTGALMAEGMESMEQLSGSMQHINTSSEKIAGVIKVVDDIAFQTNILALNAAVEAARAGDHGKGFAVVADEVRSLASKSADAAKQTSLLVQDNIRWVEAGAGMSEQASKAMQAAKGIAEENAKEMAQISESSAAQREAIQEISGGIGDFSDVVQANSATAEKAASAAREMSRQSQLLRQVVQRFKLRSTDDTPGLPGKGQP